MIIDFSVENFFSIRDRQTLSFLADDNIRHLEDYYVTEVAGKRILKAGLIFGANASGKTTILNAMDFFRSIVIDPKNSKNTSLARVPFLMNNSSRGKDTVFEINFIQNEQTYYYQLILNDQYIVSEVLKTRKNGKLVYKRKTDAVNQVSDIHWGTFSKLKDKYDIVVLAKNTLWNETVIAGFLKTNMEQPCLKEVSDWFSRYLNSIIRPSLDLTGFILENIDNGNIDSKGIIPILMKADLNISDIQIKKRSETMGYNSSRYFEDDEIFRAKIQDGSVGFDIYNLRFRHDNKDGEHFSDIKFKYESLGTQRYFGLAGILYLMIKNSCCFCLDELESSLHPELAKHFLLTFCVNTKNSQLVATTHDREFLNNKDIFRNDMIFFTEKDDACATTLYKLSDFDSSVIRNTSNILNAYNAGRLGALPNLGDYYLDINDDGNE